MLTMPSFKKSLIVEQFQGNYLKLPNAVWRRERGLLKAGRLPDKLTQKMAKLRASRCPAVQELPRFHQVNQTCFVCLEELQNG